jgi:CDGSH-type Zn-finger protein
VTILEDGPYEITGPIELADEQGQPVKIDPGETCYLCRCGASETKPFCDGTHSDIGFKGK